MRGVSLTAESGERQCKRALQLAVGSSAIVSTAEALRSPAAAGPEIGVAPADLARVTQSPLWNADLAPVPAAERRWRVGSFAALWISMSACIPTYMLASSLIGGGMNWSQAIATNFSAT